MTVSANSDIASVNPVGGRPVGSKLFNATLVGAVLAIIGNMFILTVGRGLGTEFMLVPPFGTELEAVPFYPVIMAASILPAIAAAILLYILNRRTERPYLFFWVISGVILLLSFQGPSGTLTDSPETVIGLNAMHVWSALAIVGALSALGSDQETPSI